MDYHTYLTKNVSTKDKHLRKKSNNDQVIKKLFVTKICFLLEKSTKRWKSKKLICNCLVIKKINKSQIGFFKFLTLYGSPLLNKTVVFF